eukprot:7750801-Prorocentrum_lima.AAC.1
MWIAFRTRPDICWAVTRVSRAVKANELAKDVEQRAIIQIRHILQYLSVTWQWCLVIQPHFSQSDMTIVTDASLAPSGEKS